jgi:hypothetical protein
MALIRDIHPDTLAAIGQRGFHPTLLVFVDWPTGPVRVHSGLGVIAWAGVNWQGVGDLGGISLPSELGGLAQQPGLISLGGLPAQIDDDLRLDLRGRAVQVFYGVVTARAGNVLIGTPFEVFAGAIDGVRDEQTAGTRLISLELASGPSQLRRGAAVHSHADQQARYPGDTGGRLSNALNARLAEVLKW